jgi:hypothetical protein
MPTGACTILGTFSRFFRVLKTKYSGICTMAVNNFGGGGGGGQCALLPENPPMGKTSWEEGLYVIFKQYNICSFRILFLTVKSFRNI